MSKAAVDFLQKLHEALPIGSISSCVWNRDRESIGNFIVHGRERQRNYYQLNVAWYAPDSIAIATDSISLRVDTYDVVAGVAIMQLINSVNNGRRFTITHEELSKFATANNIELKDEVL